MSKLKFSCDKATKKGRCGKVPYVEVYWKNDKEDSMGFTSHWSYLCFWHYCLDKVKNWLYRENNWYSDAEEVLEIHEMDDCGKFL